MQSRNVWAVVCVALGVGAPGAARAEAWAAPSGLHGGGLGLVESPSARLWTDVGIISKEGDTGLSPLFGVGVFVHPNVELELVLPVAFAAGDHSAASVGNVYAGASWVQNDPELHVKIGAGVGFPTEKVDDIDHAVAVSEALLARGLQDAWFWFEDSMPLVLPLHVETAGAPVVFVGDAVVYLIAPVRQRDRTDLVLQLAPGFAGYVADGVALGASLPLVALPTSDSDDKAQLSLEPFVRVAAGSAFFSARLTMPLDKPLGFAFDDAGVWGFHLGLGGAF